MNERIHVGTKYFAVIGEKLPHTLSPQIHNTAFDMMGEDAIYVSLPISREGFSSLMDVFREDFCGFNITIPYKETIMPYLDAVDESVHDFGGVVNVVKVDQGKFVGYNTDGIGFLLSILSDEIILQDKKALVIGSGGTARAIVASLLYSGAKVDLYGRTPAHVQALVQALEKPEIGIAQDLATAKGYDLVINTTPVGMMPNAGVSPCPIEIFEGVQIAFDAVYNPLHTQFLQDATKMGCKAISGIDMLLYQALESQKIWLGHTVTDQQIGELKQALYAKLEG